MNTQIFLQVVKNDFSDLKRAKTVFKPGDPEPVVFKVAGYYYDIFKYHSR